MFDRLPYYGQVALFAAMGLAIIGVAYYVYPPLDEMKVEIASLEDELATKNHEIQKGRLIEQRLPAFEREIAELERRLGDVQQILPTNRETGDLLAWIKNLGDQSNLDLKSFAPGKLTPVEWYNEFPIEMQVIGRYHDLGLFLDRVSKYQRIINVDNLRINSATSGTKTIRASFTATTFVYDDDRAAGSEGSR